MGDHSVFSWVGVGPGRRGGTCAVCESSLVKNVRYLLNQCYIIYITLRRYMFMLWVSSFSPRSSPRLLELRIPVVET